MKTITADLKRKSLIIADASREDVYTLKADDFENASDYEITKMLSLELAGNISIIGQFSDYKIIVVR